MTDFLTRMARSALGLTPVAKVLTASRYAPGPEMVKAAEQQTVATPKPERQAAEVRARPTATVMERAQPPGTPERPAHPTQFVDESPPAAQHSRQAEPTEMIEVTERSFVAPTEPAGVTSAPSRGRRDAVPPQEHSPVVVRDEEATASLVDAPEPRQPRSPTRVSHERAEPPGTPEPPAHPTQSVDESAPAAQHARQAEPIEMIEVTERSFVARAEPAAVTSAPPRGRRDAVPPQEPSASVVRDEEATASLVGAPEPRQPRSPARVSHERAPSPRTFASPLPAPARRDETAGETAAAAPVIRVTIGRVEVRAVTPPPPTEPPPPPAPRLSLDEYLRSHNGRAQ
jgi:hypothetical protein